MTFYVDPIERFFKNVEMPSIPTTCWIWHGVKSKDGYGRFRYFGETMMAHRAGYHLAIGPLNRDQHLDHLCNVYLCVNLLHLDIVTAEENNYRRWMRDPNRPKHYRPKLHAKYGLKGIC